MNDPLMDTVSIHEQNDQRRVALETNAYGQGAPAGSNVE